MIRDPEPTAFALARPRRVLVVGGAGGFGRRLVEGLLRTTPWGVVIAGRRIGVAEACAAACRARHPGRDVTALTLDARTVQPAALRATGASAVVDAAGPWQGQPPRLARAAITAGLHCVDLADARDFVAAFAVALDPAARAAGVVALTGASSTPALSSAVLDRLVAGWRDVESVEIAIAPGNRAPRGLAVVRSILSYAGRPVRLWRDGRWTHRPGWGLTTRRNLPGLGPRWLSLAATPDLDCVPARFAVRRSVTFRAGLELPVLHLGLLAASLPVRAGLLRSLAPFAPPMRVLAASLHRFGSDRGGMVVTACGSDAAGSRTRATWTLTAQAGDGPVVPTLPALAALRALDRGSFPAPPGAYACIGLLSLEDIAAEFAPHRLTTVVTRTPLADPPPLFATVLGDAAFAALPGPLRDLHGAPGWRAASGRVTVDGPTGPLAALVARGFGFPPAGADRPLRVMMETRPDGRERWTRCFGARSFTSVLGPSPVAGRLVERFGPFSFELDVAADHTGLSMRLARWRIGALPLPTRLAPITPAREAVDAAGRFAFDVEITLPFRLGRVVRYAGWLESGPINF